MQDEYGVRKNADRNVREPEVCREVCGNAGVEDARRSSLPDAVSAWAAVPPRVVLVLLVRLVLSYFQSQALERQDIVRLSEAQRRLVTDGFV